MIVCSIRGSNMLSCSNGVNSCLSIPKLSTLYLASYSLFKSRLFVSFFLLIIEDNQCFRISQNTVITFTSHANDFLHSKRSDSGSKCAEFQYILVGCYDPAAPLTDTHQRKKACLPKYYMLCEIPKDM